MKKNQLAILLGKRNYLVQIKHEKLHTEHGIIDLSELLKKKYGEKIKTHIGEEFTIAKPTLIDKLKKVKRLPQIVTPPDASLILAYTGIPTDASIVDAGSGSGFLSIFLAHYCPDGRVVTYERNPKFAKVVKKNIETAELENVTVKEKDILRGISEKNVDLVTLDMKNAEKAVEVVYPSLKTGGWIVVYSPHIEQVKDVVIRLEKLNFTDITTVESIIREWQVTATHTRPKTLGVMHTGWLTFARKF